MRSRIAVAALLTAGLMAAGCFLITGSTSGYTQALPEGGCESAAECRGDGEAGTCCLSATSGTSACQLGACGPLQVELCAKAAECADDAGCIRQSCSLGGTELEIQACGSIPLLCTSEN
jgi:hypothetical protein